VHVDRGGKLALLADVLRGEAVDRALVFTRTKHGADKVVRQLVQKGFSADAIHGNKSQNQRDRALAGFRAGRIKTLVATDIAARGIDVDGVSHVVNYDMPNVPESYVHRIGRTARAGAEGIAISFCDGEERAYLRDIERLIRMSIPATDVRGEPQIAEPQSQQPRSQPSRSQRTRPQHARPKNAKPSRSGRGGQSRKGHRNDRHGNDRQKTRDRQANSSYNGEIGTVAFMQPNN
jgi:ATP-dependent RNA helicase RhlE